MSNNDKNSNFLPLNRQFFEHKFWDEKRVYSKAEAWLDLIAMACYETSTSMIINKRPIVWYRGEVFATVRFLAERWSWSVNRVLRFIDLLEQETMIERRETPGGQVLIILNYDKYNKSGQQRRQSVGASNPYKSSFNGGKADTSGDSDGDGDGDSDGDSDGDKIKNTKKVKKSMTGSGDATAKHTQEEKDLFAQFTAWIDKHAPRVGKMKEPMTIDQFIMLRKKLDKASTIDLLVKMHNWEPLLKKNRSAYLTMLNWSRKDYNAKPQAGTAGQQIDLAQKKKDEERTRELLSQE